MDDSIKRILKADQEAKEALEKRSQQKLQLEKEFESAKRNIDEANHAAYEIESKRIDQKRDEEFAELGKNLDAAYQEKRKTIVSLFDSRSEEWIERLIKESMTNA